MTGKTTRRGPRRAACLAWATCLLPAVAAAQAPPGGGPPIGYDAGVNIAAPTTTVGNLFDATSLGKSFGRSLAEDGIYLHATIEQSTESVVSGGTERGTYYFNFSILGVDVDLGKAAGIPGGKLHVWFDDQAGQTGTAGERPDGTNIFEPFALGDQFRLLNLSYEQSFLHDRVNVQFGRISPVSVPGTVLSPPFDQATWHCQFFSYLCADPIAFALNAPKASYSTSSWGAFTTLIPFRHVYFKTGIYENEPIENANTNHGGWPGPDWGLNEAAGAFIPVQLGYQTGLGETRYPSSDFIGGYRDTAPFADRLYDTRLRPVALAGGAPLTDHGNTGYYAEAEQVFWRPDIRSPLNASAFISLNWDGSGNGLIADEIEAGSIARGIIPGRPNDLAGFTVGYARLDPRVIEARNDLRIAHHVPGNQSGSVIDYELNYGVTFAPGLQVRPYVDYVVDPDQLPLAVPKANVNHSLSVGVSMLLNLDTFLGLPQLGPTAY